MINAYVSEISGKCDAASLYLKKAHRETPDYAQPHLIEKGREAKEWADYLVQGEQDPTPLQRVVDELPNCSTLYDAAVLFENASLELVSGANPMSAHAAQDRLDGTYSTAQQNPQSILIEAVATDGSRHVYSEEDLPTGTGLTFDGEKVTHHAGKNSTVGTAIYARSRSGSAESVSISARGFTFPVKLYYGVTAELTLISYWYPSYSEALFPPELRTTDSERAWATRPKANKQLPHLLIDDIVPVDVPATGNQMFYVDVVVPDGAATGVETGEIVLTDSSGEIVIPVEVTVRNLTLSNDNAKDNMIFFNRGIHERTGGDKESWQDAGYQIAREHGLDPVGHDSLDGTGKATPEPNTEHMARITNSNNLYTGYRGDAPLQAVWHGAYGDVNVWVGVDVNQTDAQNTTAVRANIDAATAAFTTAGHTPAHRYGYTNDEGTPEAAQTRGVWYDPDNTPVIPIATSAADSDAPNAHLIEQFIAEAPEVRAHSIFGHVIPAAMRSILDGVEALPNRVWGWYNGSSPCRGQLVDEEVPLAQSLGFVMDCAVSTNLTPAEYKAKRNWFAWEAFYSSPLPHEFTASELTGRPAEEFVPTTGPLAGARSIFQNFYRFLYSFGRYFPFTGTIHYTGRGDGNNRGSNGDGVFFVAKSDIHYTDHPLQAGAVGFYPKTKAKAFRRGIQTEVVIQMARAHNQAATDALLSAFYPKTPFDVGAGSNGGGGTVDPQGGARLLGDRSYISGPDTKRFQDDITGDDYVAFERALFDILEA